MLSSERLLQKSYCCVLMLKRFLKWLRSGVDSAIQSIKSYFCFTPSVAEEENKNIMEDSLTAPAMIDPLEYGTTEPEKSTGERFGVWF